MIGKILGNRYEILDKLGDGGMATVYKAHCKLLDRYVAIKILKPEYVNDEDFIKKFNRESKSAAAISHPNIVSVYDVGVEEIDGKKIYYIVMEYIDGITLKDIIEKEAPLNEEKAVKYSIQILEALEEAHSHSIIHRDIKPHNIMITKNDRVKVTDFGIARDSTSTTVTATNDVLGSVHYLSPEQARGAYTDAKTDIYSFGIVLYEMMTGIKPYDGDNPISIAMQQIQDDITPPSRYNKNISENLERIILKCTQKKQSERYNNVSEIIEDMRNINQNNTSFNYEKFKDSDLDLTRVIQKDEIEKEFDKKKRYDEDRKEVEENNTMKKRKQQKDKGGLIGVLLGIASALIIIMIIYFAYNKITDFMKPSGENADIEVPSVIDLSEKKAKSLLETLGLKLEIIAHEKSDKEAGTIIKQDPDAGEKVKKGYTISVTVSKNEDSKTVPKVVGLDVIDAELLLNQYGLKLAKPKYEISDTVEEGLIISQEPQENAEVKEGSMVNVVISKGKENKKIQVPDLTGKTQDEAIAELKAYNLTPGKVSFKKSDAFEEGKVTGQSVSSGEEVDPKTVVNIVVSSGLINNTDDNKDDNTNKDNAIENNENKIKDDKNKGDKTGSKEKKEVEISIVLQADPQMPETHFTIVKNYNGSQETVYDKILKPSDGEVRFSYTAKVGATLDIYKNDTYVTTREAK